MGMVPFTRRVAEICVCSWTGFVPSGIESSFRLYVKNLFYIVFSNVCTIQELIHIILQALQLLEESLSSATLDIAAAPEGCWLLSHLC